jgi:hypothetical protein
MRTARIPIYGLTPFTLLLVVRRCGKHEGGYALQVLCFALVFVGVGENLADGCESAITFHDLKALAFAADN